MRANKKFEVTKHSTHSDLERRFCVFNIFILALFAGIFWENCWITFHLANGIA